MGIRIELIRAGIGRKYFLKSGNPVVRAHAAIARFSNGDLTVQELAQAMIEDCFLPDFYLNYRAAEVFRTHLSKFRLSGEEKEEVGNAFLEKADRHGEIFIQPAKHLLRLIDINPQSYFYSSTTAPFLR